MHLSGHHHSDHHRHKLRALVATATALWVLRGVMGGPQCKCRSCRAQRHGSRWAGWGSPLRHH